MKQAKVLNVRRRFQIEGPKAATLFTEKFDKKQATVTNKNGSSIVLTPNQLTKQLRSFLQATGNTIESRTIEARRGRREVAGVRVKIIPSTFVTYDNGCVLTIAEKDPVLADKKAAAIMKYMADHGVDVARECVVIEENRREGSCLYVDRRRAK